jgi:serine/threonine protein kinase
MKCLHNDVLQNKSQSLLADTINEVTSMCGLNHKHLIKLYGIVLNSGSNASSCLMMITEYAQFGSLLDYLRKSKETNGLIPIKKYYSYVFQIASGMDYLESKNLIHRDLACRNILLLSLDHVKICDFGMSRNVKNYQDGLYTMNYEQKIPCAWYPIEAIRNNLFSSKSDVWSFAVTVWEIFTYGEHPWPYLNILEILEKIDNQNQRLKKPNICSRNFYELLLKCWSKQPGDRPSFTELKTLIQKIKIVEMKAKCVFKEAGKLEIELNDLITIIDGKPDRFWWKGQNNRTMCVGYFPRAILDPQRSINGEDISVPLQNSFIHTGHMGADLHKGKSWGDPAKIDEIFLKNPLQPPDLLGSILNEDDQTKEDEEINSVEIINNSNKVTLDQIMQDINLIDFSDENILSNEGTITHPNYFRPSPTSNELDNSEISLTSGNSFDSFDEQISNQPNYVNQDYHQPAINTELLTNYSVVQATFSNNLPHTYYNNIDAQYSYQPRVQNDHITYLQQNYSSKTKNSTSTRDEERKPNTPRYEKFEFELNKKVDVDLMLSKVMDDVFNDFNNFKK